VRRAPSVPAPAAVGGAAGNAPAPEKKQKEEAPRGVTETVEVVGAAPPPAPKPSPKDALPPSASQVVVVESQAQQLDSSNGAISNAVTAREVHALDLKRLAATDRHYILSPSAKIIWRLGDAGKIERSSDYGKTWSQQNSGVTADLVAGSATSDKVSWVLGKAGTLLLTTDGGKHWKQISSPLAGDIGGIHATDASHASIWDVPNRNSFETTDGGATWHRAGNE
jgi:hypothetical protein